MKKFLLMLGLMPSLVWAMEHDPRYSYTLTELAVGDKGSKEFSEGGWIGGDINRLWWQVHAAGEGGKIGESAVSAWYGRYVAPFWDAQIGMRFDLKPQHQQYLSLGLRGLAPYQFDTDIKLDVRNDGKLFLHGRFEQDWLLTNRVILTPWADGSISASNIDSTVRQGLYQAALGAQLRYEFSRKFAPYLEVSRTVHPVAQNGGSPPETLTLLGLRLIF